MQGAVPSIFFFCLFGWVLKYWYANNAIFLIKILVGSKYSLVDYFFDLRPNERGFAYILAFQDFGSEPRSLRREC